MKIKVYACLLKRLLFGKGLKEMHFSYRKDESGKYYQRHLDDNQKEELREIKRYCRRRLLRCRASDDRMERSNTYRANFFRHNRGMFGGGELYLCAYCGRPLKKSKVRVDHIIPVYLAGHSLRYRNMLTVRGIKTVNDPRNLTASCAKCNGRKSSYGGIWVIRGYFGQSWVRVLLKEALFLIIGGIALYYLYNFLSDLPLYFNA